MEGKPVIEGEDKSVIKEEGEGYPKIEGEGESDTEREDKDELDTNRESKGDPVIKGGGSLTSREMWQ